MKYFAYKENGDFNGFYTEDIHLEIPEKSIKLTEYLWKELLKNNYKYKLNMIEDKVLDVADKDIYFDKVEIKVYDAPKLPNAQELLAQQVTNLLLENKKKDAAITKIEANEVHGCLEVGGKAADCGNLDASAGIVRKSRRRPTRLTPL